MSDIAHPDGIPVHIEQMEYTLGRDTFRERLRLAAERGYMLAASTTKPRSKQTTHEERAALADLTAYADGHIGVQHALYALCTYSAAEQFLAEKRTGKFPFDVIMLGLRRAVHANRYLCSAFLCVPPAAREIILDQGSHIGVRYYEWRRICVGAGAMARLCLSLDRLELPISYSSTWQDINLGIDLLCGPLPNGMHAGINVTSCRDKTNTFVLHQDGGGPYPTIRQPPAELQRLSRGIRAFNEKYHVDWKALLMDIEITCLEIIQLEDCGSLMKELREFLSSLPAPVIESVKSPLVV